MGPWVPGIQHSPSKAAFAAPRLTASAASFAASRLQGLGFRVVALVVLWFGLLGPGGRVGRILKDFGGFGLRVGGSGF